MKNESGVHVDLYIPRRCSVSNKIIHAKEHGSTQIGIAQVDAQGVATSDVLSFVIASRIRRAGDSDAALMKLCQENGLMPMYN